MDVSAENPFEGLEPDELRRRLLGFATLVDVTRNLAAEIDLERILETITRESCRALDCERASLFQYDEQRGELFTRVTTELEIAEIRGSIEQGVTGYAARNRTTTNIDDPRNDPRWNSSIDRATGFYTRNLLATPILLPHLDRLLGVLEFINKRGRGFDAFDEELAQAFTQHAAAALERARLVEEVQRRQAMQTSLELAREIQRGFMPETLIQTPGYDSAAWWFPNEAVGGDYCDVVRLLDGRTGFVVADVSGHGLGPSLIMASVRAGLRALMLEQSDTASLVTRLARSMQPDLRDGRFITLIFAALDPVRHTVCFANAGHAPAYHYRPATGEFSPLHATGLPLGVLDVPRYREGTPLSMQPGDVVLLCTDGIVEAMNERAEQFGHRRLRQIVVDCGSGPIDVLVDEIRRRVEAHFVGEAPPDDLTVLAVKRRL